MTIKRRQFLVTGLSSAALLLMGSKSIASEKATKSPSVGIQLYCVRGEFEKDVPGTLKKLADMGYQGVEFWGYGGSQNIFQNYSAQALKAMLDETGLKCCGMHLQLKALLGEAFLKTVINNKILENNFLTVAAAQEQMASPESIKAFAAQLSSLAEKAKELDMRVGYHCHGFDMTMFDGRSGWDLLFSQTSPDVMMQMDTGNCFGGGGDPIAVLKKFPGRATQVHIKEYSDALFAPGNKKWNEIFHLCEQTQNTEWYIVEQGGEGGLGLDIPKKCLEQLRKMGKLS